MRIDLRPWQRVDAEDLLAVVQSADDLASQLPQPLGSVNDARRVIDTVLVCDDLARHLAVVVDGHAVGNVAVSHIERTHQTGWVSYFSSGAVRGQGLVKRSVTELANWALADLGLFRLELGHRVNNPASAAVALAAGFVPEGLERQKLRYGDTRYDVRTYARLATDPVPTAADVHLDRR